MVPPVQVSPLIKFGRYSALLVGIVYGRWRFAYLKPVAEEDRRIEAQLKKEQEEAARIARELAVPVHDWEGDKSHQGCCPSDYWKRRYPLEDTILK